MIVYIITAGEYSDYHICGVCSTREQAEAALPLYTDRDSGSYESPPNIEEWEVDVASRIPQGLLPFEVGMDREGNLREAAYRLTLDSFDDSRNGMGYPSHPTRFFHLWARDEQHAVKIANEKRAQMIASGDWK